MTSGKSEGVIQQYRSSCRENGVPRWKAIVMFPFVGFLYLLVKPVADQAERQQRYQSYEEMRVKQRERWRMEAREEYDNE